MPDIIVIKTSSLGDVVHNMPAISDIRLHRPDARVTWVVEEDFAPLARLHPAVDAVVPVATRRWRRQLHRIGTWREIGAFLSSLRGHRYDEIVDSQGLTRTALMARLARGRRHGYDADSIRERFASAFYDVRHRVDWQLHAIDRNRLLTAKALGYVPEGPPDYGLPRAASSASGKPYAVLLHGSAEQAKEWPESRWIAVGKALQAGGYAIVLPWGNAREHQRSAAIAGALGQAQVPERAPLDRVAGLIAGASLVVGLDTGLVHLAAAYAVPLVAIFVNSDPDLTGPRGRGPMTVVGTRGAAPEAEAVVAAARRIGSIQAA